MDCCNLEVAAGADPVVEMKQVKSKKMFLSFFYFSFISFF
jgi:hypothetical protein